MDRQARRQCPICGGSAGTRTFPYKTRFNDVVFDYVRCRSCSSVFVDPVPDANTFALMYSKASYHDVHYIDCESAHYGSSARLLRDFLPVGASVLDYGCGLGLFLKALKVEGFSAPASNLTKKRPLTPRRMRIAPYFRPQVSFRNGTKRHMTRSILATCSNICRSRAQPCVNCSAL